MTSQAQAQQLNAQDYVFATERERERGLLLLLHLIVLQLTNYQHIPNKSNKMPFSESAALMAPIGRDREKPISSRKRERGVGETCLLTYLSL